MRSARIDQTLRVKGLSQERRIDVCCVNYAIYGLENKVVFAGKSVLEAISKIRPPEI
jgi:hypothetical protein